VNVVGVLDSQPAAIRSAGLRVQLLSPACALFVGSWVHKAGTEQESSVRNVRASLGSRLQVRIPKEAKLSSRGFA